MLPVAVPPFWHSLPSAPVEQEVVGVGQLPSVPQAGSVPALPKLEGSEEMSCTHQEERSWENAVAE